MAVNGIKEEIKDMYSPQMSALSTTFDTTDPFSFLKSHFFGLHNLALTELITILPPPPPGL